MNPARSLCARLGVEVPIFQAPIGAPASIELAASVSNAGGVGHVACTWRSPAETRDLLRSLRALTSHRFGANFVLAFPIEERLSVALEHGVGIVSFFWGDATRFVERVKAAGAFVIQIVGSVDEAKRAADAGIDAIVAQGREAGGHVRGDMSTMTLVPSVIDAVEPLPVLAAGGIADRRGVAAALALGAAGVWVGTRFLAALETNIHPVYRELVLAASGADTIYSQVFDVGWPNAPLRTLRNRTIRAWQAARESEAPEKPEKDHLFAQRPDGAQIPRYHFASPTRDTVGDIEAMAHYAGEAVGLVQRSQPAADIVADLAMGLPWRPAARCVDQAS